MEQETNETELWKMANRRVQFKYHALIYFIMNIFFWTLWYISLKNVPIPKPELDTIPWPVWPMLGWGIGLAFNYFYAFKKTGKEVEKEFQKLKNKQ